MSDWQQYFLVLFVFSFDMLTFYQCYLKLSNMGVPKRLTEMQKRFAEFVVFGGSEGPMTQGEAAIAAGYAKDSARVEGSQLLNPRYSPVVVQFVGKLKEER